MRIAFYVRVSTERQQQAQTIEQQVALLRAYVAERRGWVIEEQHMFRDDGHTGAKLQRPGLDALRDQAARAAFDVVLVTAPDRLARNYVHQMVILEELERHGISVVFIDRPPNDDPHEQLVTQIRGAVAEYERTLIADRMRRGRQAKLRAGRLLPWTNAAYGYRVHPERPRDPALVEIEEAAAAVVRELFQAYADGEATLHALAVRLTARGIASPTGRSFWSASSVRGILSNPAYIGEAVSGRLQSRPARGRRSALEPVGRGISTQATARDHWITVPVPAIVSTDVFNAAQQRLATNQQLARRNNIHPYLLRGLVSCGHCQLSCTGRAGHPSATYQYYVCRGKLPTVVSNREKHCPSRLIPTQQLDALVWDDLCQMVRHPAVVAHELQRAQAGDWVPEELRRRQASLRGVRVGLSRQQARLLEAYLAGVLDLATFEFKRNELGQREEEVLAREREVVAQGQRLVAVENLARSTTQILEQLTRGLEQASFEQRRELVELLIDRVVVTDDAVEIRYVIPTTEASTHTRFCQLRTDYFHSFADALADGIARPPGGSAIDRAAPPAGVLGDVWRHARRPHLCHQVACVVPLVCPQRPWMEAALLQPPNEAWHHGTLGRPAGRGHREVHQQAGAILHQRVSQVAEFGRLAARLLVQPRVWIGVALVRLVRAFLPVEVDPAVVRIVARRPGALIRGLVLGSEALQAGCCFDQRAVDREVLVAQQVQPVRLEHHLVEEALADTGAQQPLAILREGGVVEAGLDQVHVQAPAEQEVVVQFLAEGPLAAHRVQAHRQTGLQQPLRRDGRSAVAIGGVQRVEQWRQLGQRGIGKALDGAQRVVQRDARLQVQTRQHAHLRVLPSAHSRHLRRRWLYPTQCSRPPGRPPMPGLFQHPVSGRASASPAALQVPGFGTEVNNFAVRRRQSLSQHLKNLT
jgi:site-specific DNA recombinase